MEKVLIYTDYPFEYQERLNKVFSDAGFSVVWIAPDPNDGSLKERACREALKQIKERKYAEGLKRRGMKKILEYGIAFCGKECMVMIA